MAKAIPSPKKIVVRPSEPADRSTEAVDLEPRPRLPFPVVGMGASAGGLEAFSEFFNAMPIDSGIAFVLIQHLPPERESMLAEILGRQTRMPVFQVTDGVRLEPNKVYVIRPGRTLTIRDGSLHLGEPLERRGHQRPVDDFFRSLAEEQRERAIAVVMSGMGSNGTAGAQAVKAVGGLCIAQDPESARFPSMPRSLFDAGFADFVLRPAEIPELLIRYTSHPYARGAHPPELATGQEQAVLNEILSLLRKRLRHDFSGYKKSTLFRRVERRMGLNQITELGDYTRLLRQNPTEIVALNDDLMIHVTGFFRDTASWDALRTKAIDPLVAQRPTDTPIRAWVTACSSGEEAYSLAMLLVEAAHAAGKEFDIKVFATDTAERTLAHARAGIYPGGIESEISPERLERFFDKDENNYHVKKSLRDQVVFAPQNLLQDPPFSRIDICTCRNLLIYLEADMQRRALAMIHFGLRDGGTLLLGSSETVAGMDELFEPIDKKHRLFRRVGPTRHGEIEFPSLHASGAAAETNGAKSRSLARASIAQLTNKALLDRYGPAAVVIDREQHIVYFHGHTERYLDQPRGEPTRQLLSLARESVRGALRTALQRALAQKQQATVRNGIVETVEGRCRVEVVVAPLEPGADPIYYLVSFHEHREPPPPPRSTEHTETRRQLEEELQRIRDELQSTIQELQTSNEELKASNEEATSINEELQSTNEELETSKEELQSLNEELTTVNAQFQAKLEELEATSNDLSSLLSSTDIAVVFLDRQFRIRRYTPAVSDLLVLIPSDIGRPLSDLARKFRDDDLLKDAQSVLDKLQALEKEIVSESGRAYLRRALPYRTADDRIDGVVVTFIDITARKAAEAALRESEERHRLILEGINEYAIFMVDPNGRITTWNTGAERLLGYAQTEVIGQPLALVFTPEDRAAGVPEQELEEARELGAVTREGWRVRKDGRRFFGAGTLAQLVDDAGRLRGYVKLLRDNTERKLSEEALRQAKLAAEATSRAKDNFLASVSHELRTPLSAIVLWTSLIEDQKIVDPEQLAEALSSIRRSAEEQRKLIEDLVDTARIAAGKLRLDLRPVQAAEIVRAAVDLLRPLATEKKIDLSEQIDPAANTIEADASRLQQVVNNLLHNAVKFTPTGGRVTVELRRTGEEMRIVVSDTGIGIEPGFLPNIFERFAQAETVSARTETVSARTESGLGLGLAIAKQIVEMHGGSITAESAGSNRGATFTVRLPASTIESHAGTTNSGEKSRLANLLAGRTVLLIEDVAATRRALTAVLQQSGAEVAPVESAPAAWETLERRRPDVIVSDLGLPLIDGYAFIRQVREAEKAVQARPVPAVALTAFAGEGVSRKALEEGFQTCLTKPIEPQRLVNILAALIAKK